MLSLLCRNFTVAYLFCGVVRSVWDDGVGKGGFSVYGGSCPWGFCVWICQDSSVLSLSVPAVNCSLGCMALKSTIACMFVWLGSKASRMSTYCQ